MEVQGAEGGCLCCNDGVGVFEGSAGSQKQVRLGWCEVIVIVGEIVMLARTGLALTTRVCHGGDSGIVAHGAGHRGEVR